MLGLGTDTGDSAPSVLLFFDHYRFLFNAGEGFQRFCVQHRIRMGKTSSVFATRSTTQALGGLPGESVGVTMGTEIICLEPSLSALMKMNAAAY